MVVSRTYNLILLCPLSLGAGRDTHYCMKIRVQCLNAHNFIYKKYVNEPDAGIVFSLTNCLIKGSLVSVKAVDRVVASWFTRFLCLLEMWEL